MAPKITYLPSVSFATPSTVYQQLICDSGANTEQEIVEKLLQLLYPASQEVVAGPKFKEGHSEGTPIQVQDVQLRDETAMWMVPCVVKYGPLDLILGEHRNYQDWVRPFLNIGSYAEILDPPVILGRFAAIKYHCVGGHAPRENFADFFRRKKSTLLGETTPYPHLHEDPNIRDILAIIQHIYDVILQPWLVNRKYGHHIDLASEFVQPLIEDFEEIGRGIAELGKADPHEISDYITLLANRFGDNKGVICWEICSHGDLHGKNILLDHTSRPWLIDFAKTKRGHCLRDFCKLECYIKYEIWDDSLDSARMISLEKTLLTELRPQEAGSLLRTEAGKLNFEERKRLASVLFIRDHARSMLAHLGFPETYLFPQYLMCLLRYTLPVFKYGEVSIQGKELALWSAKQIFTTLLASQSHS